MSLALFNRSTNEKPRCIRESIEAMQETSRNIQERPNVPCESHHMRIQRSTARTKVSPAKTCDGLEHTKNCFGCEMLHRSLTMCRCYTKNLCHQRRTTSKRYTKNAKAGKAAIFIHISAKAFSSRQRGAETAIYIEFAVSYTHLTLPTNREV